VASPVSASAWNESPLRLDAAAGGTGIPLRGDRCGARANKCEYLHLSRASKPGSARPDSHPSENGGGDLLRPGADEERPSGANAAQLGPGDRAGIGGALVVARPVAISVDEEHGPGDVPVLRPCGVPAPPVAHEGHERLVMTAAVADSVHLLRQGPRHG